MRASERAWMSKVPRSGNSRTIYHGKFFAKRLNVCESITGNIPSVPTSCTAAMYNSSLPAPSLRRAEGRADNTIAPFDTRERGEEEARLLQ